MFLKLEESLGEQSGLSLLSNHVCNRIGLTDAKVADKTAQQLEERTPDWALQDGHFWLIQFGKKICTSRSPKCDRCPVSDICLWFAAQTK